MTTTIPDACKRLAMSYATVYRLMLSGQLPAKRGIDGRWKLDAAGVEKFARSRAAAESNGHEPEPAA